MADRLLDGIEVIDASAEPGGAYAAKLLADYGAAVVKVEPPTGDPVRRQGPFARDRVDAEASLLFAYVNRNKRGLAIDLGTRDGRAVLDRLLARSDVLIESFRADEAQARDLSPARVREANPRIVHASVTPFGKTGPSAGFAAVDLEAPALSGWTYLTGEADRAPIQQGGNVPRLAPGLIAVAGILGALYGRERTGRGEFVDVSAQEAGAVMHPFTTLFSSYQGGQVVRRSGSRLQTTHPFSILPCRDGYIGAICLTDQQWASLCSLMGLEHVTDDPRFQTNLPRAEHADALDELMSPWLQARTADEIFHLAQAFRVPFALVPSTRDLIGLDQLRERDFWLTVDHPSLGALRQPGLPFQAAGAPGEVGRPAPRLSEHTAEILAELGYSDQEAIWIAASQAPERPRVRTVPRVEPARDLAVPAGPDPADLPLAGVRIVDLTMYWAGPLATRLAADLGAEVIKVEAIQRLDGWRGTFLKASYERPYEASPVFNGVNCNKLGITLNLAAPRGLELAKRLVAQSNAVVENYSPRVLGQLGLSYETLRAIRPEIVLLSMSGFGATGPWRDYVAYAATVECLSGIAWLTGYKNGPPMLGGASIGDPISGLNGAVALLMALLYQQRTGRGLAIDLSQIEAAICLLGDAVLDYTVNGRVSERTGNDHPAIAPHGIFRTAGEDDWIAITAATDAQWRSLCAVLDRPALTEDPRFATGLARWHNREALHAIIGKAVRDADQMDLMHRLQAAGVPAAAVLNGIQLEADPRLAHRQFFTPLDRAFVGTHAQPASGLRLGDRTLGARTPAPTLGEHNDLVLSGLLGLSRDEIESLAAEGIIGMAPAAG